MLKITGSPRARAIAIPQGKRRLLLASLLLLGGAVAAAYLPRAAAATPAPGDTYVYRIIDGYNQEPRGQVSYRVDKTESNRLFLSVSTERNGATLAATEVITPEGNWLRHAVINRDRAVDYEFAQAFPAYALPLEDGKQWTQRVDAVDPQSGKTRSVRVDAAVVGNERIRVPAGEFDTIKIRRQVFAGDAEYNLRETTISEMEWYAPALGRSVRIATDSAYRDTARGPRNQVIRGDWNIYELVSAPVARG